MQFHFSGIYYSDSIINSACIRADKFGCYSFKSVKRICEEGLFEVSSETNTSAVGVMVTILKIMIERVGGAK